MKSSTAWPAFTISMTLRGRFSMADHLLDRMGADNGLPPLGGVVQEFVDLGHGAIERHHRVAVVVHVENEVLAHDGQTDQCDVCRLFHDRFAPSVAGEMIEDISLIPDSNLPYNMGRPNAAAGHPYC